MKMNRRTALKTLGLGAGVLAFPELLLAEPKPVAKVKAKSVIQIWLNGGMSHNDTWDYKEEGGFDYHAGVKALPQSKTGCFSEWFPRLDAQFDKFSIIHSMTHRDFGHETASYRMQCNGHIPGERLSHPSLGAVFAWSRRASYKGILPSYIVMTQPQGRFSEEGFLGPAYKAWATSGDPNAPRFEVEGVVAKGITDARQKIRRDLLHKMNTLGNSLPQNPQIVASKDCEEKAYELLLGKGKEIFDLSLEKDSLRDAYGRNTFGQECLVATRLAAAEVPYCVINYPAGWDTHKGHTDTMRRQCPALDQGLAMLLQGLSDRGLLESTLVWCCGEFGRSPKSDFFPPWTPDGKGHFGNVFSVLVSGGGFKGGHIVGKSNDLCTEVAERPVYPRDLAETILTLAGIDGNALLPHPLGLHATVLPSLTEEGVKAHGMLSEIM